MLKFAIKNLLIKKVQVILIILSIMVSASIAVMAFNVSTQVSDGLTNNSQYYSLIIGPSGSETQLAMNSMFFTDEPLGTIPYSIKIDLEKDSRVKTVVPFAMADQYNGYKIVGSTSKYLESKTYQSGECFLDSSVFQIVVGANVAQTCNLHIGDQIYTSHSVGEEHHTPFTVVGILERTYSSFDNILFTEIQSIWQVHEEEHEEGEHEEGEHEEGEHEEGEHEEHNHEEMNNMACSFLVTTINPTYAMQLQQEYDGKIVEYDDGVDIEKYTLQAIEPMAIMRNVLEDTDQTKYIVYALAFIILLMNILIISIITVLNMYQSEKDIKLMRLIGISMKKINLLYLIQNAFIGLISIILALGVSRLGLLLMNGYASNMGIVLNNKHIYPFELVIMSLVFIINVIPTLIWTSIMSRKDGLN